MKKTIGIILASLLCFGGFAIAEDKDPRPVAAQQDEKTNFVLGRDAISQIRKNYEAGKYDDFLKETDASYEQVKESGQLASFASLRENAMLDAKWLASLKDLQKDKNDQLLQTVAAEDSLFGDKVRASAAPFSAAQEAAIAAMQKFHQMAPGTGSNSDENVLVAIDVEYEYKTVHLNMPGQLDDAALKEKHYALKMEQMNKMLLASQSFENGDLKQQVTVFGDLCDEQLAKTWDQVDLQALAKGKIKPSTRTQERVAAVLQSHQDKMSDLASKS